LGEFGTTVAWRARLAPEFMPIPTTDCAAPPTCARRDGNASKLRPDGRIYGFCSEERRRRGAYEAAIKDSTSPKEPFTEF
jgi:hypothetical protein